MSAKMQVMARGGVEAGVLSIPAANICFNVFRDYKGRGYFLVEDDSTYHIVRSPLPEEICKGPKNVPLLEDETQTILSLWHSGLYESWQVREGDPKPVKVREYPEIDSPASSVKVTVLGMRITGAELVAFYNDWPMGDDWYHEDGWLSPGVSVDPAKLQDVDDAIGVVMWQGDDPTPSYIEINGYKVYTDEDGALDPCQCVAAWRGDDRQPVVLLLTPEQEARLVQLCRDNNLPTPKEARAR